MPIFSHLSLTDQISVASHKIHHGIKFFALGQCRCILIIVLPGRAWEMATAAPSIEYSMPVYEMMARRERAGRRCDIIGQAPARCDQTETLPMTGFPAMHGLVRGVRPEFRHVASRHRVRRDIQ